MITKLQRNLQILNKSRTQKATSDITRSLAGNILTQLPENQQPDIDILEETIALGFESDNENRYLQLMVFNKNIQIYVEKYDETDGGWDYVEGDLVPNKAIIDVIRLFYDGCDMDKLERCVHT
jgi:hypothetical protein